MANNKMTKDTIPNNFTISLALLDFLPVAFFAGFGAVIGVLLNNNAFVILGATIAFVSGFLKVIWKIIVVLKKKNVWCLFMQMRIAMPVGLIIMLAAILYEVISRPFFDVVSKVLAPPQLIFWIIGIIGICGMIFSAKKLDSSDAKSNWIEQGINSVAQLAFFIGAMCMLSMR